MSIKSLSAVLVIAVEAPCPGYVRLAIHPDLSDDSLPFLKPLRSLQFFCWCEHVHVERTFKTSVSPRRQVWSCVPVRVWVAGIGGRVGRMSSFFDGGPLAGLTVGAARDLDHQGEECKEETQTHAADKEERCPLWVVCERDGES